VHFCTAEQQEGEDKEKNHLRRGINNNDPEKKTDVFIFL
jgi:hypothetical protein